MALKRKYIDVNKFCGKNNHTEQRKLEMISKRIRKKKSIISSIFLKN